MSVSVVLEPLTIKFYGAVFKEDLSRVKGKEKKNKKNKIDDQAF